MGDFLAGFQNQKESFQILLIIEDDQVSVTSMQECMLACEKEHVNDSAILQKAKQKQQMLQAMDFVFLLLVLVEVEYVSPGFCPPPCFCNKNRFMLDSYRRLIQMYGNVVLKIDSDISCDCSCKRFIICTLCQSKISLNFTHYKSILCNW